MIKVSVFFFRSYTYLLRLVLRLKNKFKVWGPDPYLRTNLVLCPIFSLLNMLCQYPLELQQELANQEKTVHDHFYNQ